MELAQPRDFGDLVSINELNAHLPYPLPQRLTDIMEKFPGPIFLDPCEIKTQEEMAFLPDGKVKVSSILGRNTGAMGLLKEYRNFGGRVRSGLVPIADTHAGSNKFFLDMSKGSDGPVFFWWHEAPVSENSCESLCLVGETLDEFLDAIAPVEETSLR